MNALNEATVEMVPNQVDNFTFILKNMGYVTAFDIKVKLRLDGLIDLSGSSIADIDLNAGFSKNITLKLKAMKPGKTRSLTLIAKGENRSNRIEFFGKRTDKIVIEGRRADPR